MFINIETETETWSKHVDTSQILTKQGYEIEPVFVNLENLDLTIFPFLSRMMEIQGLEFHIWLEVGEALYIIDGFGSTSSFGQSNALMGYLIGMWV